jgi:transcriptional regulator with XRE-family HTH domain
MSLSGKRPYPTYKIYSMQDSLLKNNLREMRKQKGLTQRQVASLLGLQCESRLSQWENGTAMPSVYNALKLSQIYNTELADLFRINTE